MHEHDSATAMSMTVQQPGVLSLLQDSGRFGQHAIGLTHGGPIDPEAMFLANRLLDNPVNSTCIEVSFGGLVLEAGVDTAIACTGGDAPLSINGAGKAGWRSHAVSAGDTISIGYASLFCRSYLAVAGGFQIPPQFGSSATVVREGIGGLNGGKLNKGDRLPCPQRSEFRLQKIPEKDIPIYQTDISVRVIPGYQQQAFPKLQQRRFFSSAYTVTERADRMGYRLAGPVIECDIEGILSEGICHGAIQIPADGQPIVLLNDRQTIGGYPKIGSALSLDTARLGQLTPAAQVRFTAIDMFAAHNALALQQHRLSQVRPECCGHE